MMQWFVENVYYVDAKCVVVPDTCMHSMPILYIYIKMSITLDVQYYIGSVPVIISYNI